MRVKGTLILFVVAAALAAYYLLVERPRQRAQETERAQAARLADFSPDRAVTLTIRRPDATLEFAASGTGWEMRRPLRDAAEAAAVSTLLAAWADADVARNLGPADDPARYGLDRPISLRATFEDGDSAALDLGGTTVDKSRLYATRHPGGEVLLVPTDLRRYAERETPDFRNQRVISFDLSVVDSFDVVSPGRSMRWRHAGEAWTTRQDGRVIAGDPDAVTGLLRTLRGLRVRRFPTDVEAQAGFPRAPDPDHPATATYVRIFKAPPNPSLLLTLAPAGAFVLARLHESVDGVRVDVPGNDRVVEVDSTVLSIFTHSLADLRDRRLLRFDPSQVARIALTTPDTIATLVRTGSAWTYPNPSLGTLDARRVRAVLDAAAALRARRVLSEAPAQLPGPPTFTLALFDGGGNLIDELSCRRTAGGEPTLLATSRSLPVLGEVASGDLERVVTAVRRIHR